MRISLCLPSRGRPEGLRRMVTSARFSAAWPNRVQVVVVLDEDDPQLRDYARVSAEPGIHAVIVPRMTMSDYWNVAAASAEGEVLMLAADDIVFRSTGWDAMVEEAFWRARNRIALVYGRDGHADERMATHPFVSRQWVDTVGWMTQPGFVSDYADKGLHDMAEELGVLRYLPDVVTEHMHYAFGKGELDQTHRDRLDRAAATDMPELYEATRQVRSDAIERLRVWL